jgi:hypothetical protein
MSGVRTSPVLRGRSVGLQRLYRALEPSGFYHNPVSFRQRESTTQR